MTCLTEGGFRSQRDWCRIYGGTSGFRKYFLWIFRSLLPYIFPPVLYSYSYVITMVENRAIRGDSYTLPVYTSAQEWKL